MLFCVCAVSWATCQVCAAGRGACVLLLVVCQAYLEFNAHNVATYFCSCARTVKALTVSTYMYVILVTVATYVYGSVVSLGWN